MKYMVILGDGMADWKLSELGDKTPLEAADTPNLDALAAQGELGMVRTIPEGMAPGSDTANLSVMGYDPVKYYTGRSPLEALSIGVAMKDSDVVFRCNLVTLTEEEKPYAEQRILDHSADEIGTEEAEILLKAVCREFTAGKYRFYTGTSYRHCMVWEEGQVLQLMPPHDILTKKIGPYLPGDEVLQYMQQKSYEILKDHPINAARKAKGLRPANSFWFWGAGTKPSLPSFAETYRKKGAMISAVDLLKGIAVGAQMDCISVEGANGGLHTNYEGKAQAAVEALTGQGYDFVYVHVEAPDEMGHQGSADKKIQAIEYLDFRVIGPIKKSMDASGEDYRMLILPDHPTPIPVRTHVAEPVPYLLYDSRKAEKHSWRYSEEEAAASGNIKEHGWELLRELFEEP